MKGNGRKENREKKEVENNKLKLLGASLLVFVIYTAVTYLLLPQSLAFEVSFGFLFLAFVVFLGCVILSAANLLDAEGMLYTGPLLRVAGGYVLAGCVLHMAFSLTGGIPVKILVAVELIVLAVFGAWGVTVQMATSHAREQRSGQKRRTASLAEVTDLVKEAADKAGEEELRKKLQRTAEDLRLAPVLTNDRLADQDEKMEQAAQRIVALLEQGDTAAAELETHRLVNLLRSRNRAAGRA